MSNKDLNELLEELETKRAHLHQLVDAALAAGRNLQDSAIINLSREVDALLNRIERKKTSQTRAISPHPSSHKRKKTCI